MRSFKVYAIKDGGTEQYIYTAYSPTEGKQIYQMLKRQGYFDEMVVRDALGGKQMHRSLRTEENLMEYA
jgi:hypothetical protein